MYPQISINMVPFHSKYSTLSVADLKGPEGSCGTERDLVDRGLEEKNSETKFFQKKSSTEKLTR